MFTKYCTVTRIYGFGATEEESIEELEFNKAREDINNDTSGYYMKRRQDLYSWLPLPTLLSIKGVCSISYESGYLVNTETGVRIPIENKPLSHYLYLFSLLDGKITFADFTVTISKEVNRFLANISNNFGTLSEFPSTKPADLSVAVNMHYLRDNLGFVCDTTDGTVIVSNYTKVLSIPLIQGVDKDCLIAYGLAKLGVIYDGTNVKSRK